MGTLGLVLFIVLLTGGIAWIWVRGIDYMKQNHPDYKGEIFWIGKKTRMVLKLLVGVDGMIISFILKVGYKETV